MNLSHFEILVIENYFQEYDLTDGKYSAELLDHFCCMVESSLSETSDFKSSFEKVKGLFPEEDLYKNYLLIKKQSQMMTRRKHLTISLPIFSLIALFSVQVWAQNIPSISPLGPNFQVTSGFGMRIHPIHKTKKLHKGIDFRVKEGTSVVATASGRVNETGYNDGHGNYIILDHEEGYQTMYANLQKVNLEEGAAIKKGEEIGLSGNTGASTAPHLHYEVLKNGKNIDPKEYLKP